MKSIKFTKNSQITQFDKSQPLSNYISQVPDDFSLKSILKTTQPKIKTPRHHPYRPSVATPLTVTSYTTHSSRFSKPESDHDATDKLSQLSIDFGENSESDNDLKSKFHKDSFSRVLEKLSNRPSKIKNSEAIEKIKKGIAKYFFKDRNCLEFVDFINGNPKVIQGPRASSKTRLRHHHGTITAPLRHHHGTDHGTIMAPSWHRSRHHHGTITAPSWHRSRQDDEG